MKIQGNIKWSFVLLLLIAPLLGASQAESYDEIADQCYDVLYDYEACITCSQKLLELSKKEEKWDDYVANYERMGISAYVNYKYAKAKVYFEQGLQIMEEKNIPSDSYTAFVFKQNYAGYLYTVAVYDEAFTLIQSSLETYQSNRSSLLNALDSNDIASVYSNMGVMHKTFGNYAKAKKKGLLALSYFPDSLRRLNHYEWGDCHHNLGVYAMEMNDYENAFYNFNKALQIYSTKENRADPYVRVSIINTENSIAEYYLKTEQYEQALNLSKETLNKPENESKKYLIYNTLGDIYFQIKKNNKALVYYNKSLELRKAMYPNQKHTDIAIVENQIGKVYKKIGKTTAALNHYQAALIQLVDNFNNEELYANPNHFESISSYPNLLKALRNKGELLQQRYFENQNIEDLKQALIPLSQALTQIENIRRSYRSEDARLQLTQSAIPIFESAISVTHQLYELTGEEEYLTKAYELTEKSKAVTLLEAFKESDAKSFSGISQELLEQERELKREVLLYTQLYNSVAKGTDEKLINEMLTNYTSASDAYDNFIEQLETDYPKYYDLKYNTTVVTIDEVQEQLLQSDKEGIIEYFIGENNIFTFAFSNEKVSFNKIDKPTNFDKILTDFRHSISDFAFISDSLNDAYALYSKSAYQLYDWLLKESLEALPNAENIMVIPDGYLSYVPFETLIGQKAAADDDFRTLPYLIKEYNFGYAYSTTLIQQVLERKVNQNPKAGYGGFAAKYSETDEQRDEYVFAMRSGAQPLPSAVKEVKKIAKIVKGKSWIGNTATEKNFKRYAPSYQTLHLSMHGILDDELPLNSHLLFTDSDTSEDNKLTALEIYNMEFNAELAVLSACNTGMGKVHRGEGVMSLSRAFTYAGCPSMIMSLWSVPDEATGEIMVDFFANLSKGQLSKSAALRTAKLAYLEGKDDYQSHPIFWAGFVPMGDNAPVQLKQQSNLMWYVVGGVGLLFVFFLFIKRRNN